MSETRSEKRERSAVSWHADTTMMRLDELLGRLSTLEEDALLFVAPPYLAKSVAAVGPSAPSGLRCICDVRTAKAMLAPYASDPIAMSVARFRARAEALDIERSRAANAALTFAFDGMPVGAFIERAPSGDGHYRYMPLRGAGHFRLGQSLQRGGRPACVMSGCQFIVVGIPSVHTIEITEWIKVPSR